MTIASILSDRSGEVYTIEADKTVAEVASILAEKRIGALPIVVKGEVQGIFSERDLVYGVAAFGSSFMDAIVSEVMTKPAITIDSNTNIMAALSLMTKRRIRHLPVVDNGQLVAFVSIGDLVKYRIDKIETEAAAMRDYIQTV